MSAQHHCVNCGIATWRSTTIGIQQLEDEGILSVIQQWIAPQVVNNSHHICQACRNLAVIAMGINESPPHVTTGHRQVCINCGRSVLRARSHVLRTDTERENMIRTVIREWIIPRSIPHGRALICHSCWVRANRDARHFVGYAVGWPGPITESTSGMMGDMKSKCVEKQTAT